MTNRRLTVPLLIAVLLASVPFVQAAEQAPPGIYPTTGSPDFLMPNSSLASQPTAPLTPSPLYMASVPASYGPYPPVSGYQVASASPVPCAAPAAAAPATPQPSNPYLSPNCSSEVGPCLECPSPVVWVASASGLLMTVEEGEHYFFSYDDDDESQQFTDWRDASIGWGGGFEIQLRRYDMCTCAGWEAIYWGFWPGASTTSTYDTDVVGNLNGILNWDQLDYGNTVLGETGADYVNNALLHRLRHEVSIHNVEANRVMLLGNTGCTPWRGEMLCGLRVFRFEDDLQFASYPTPDPDPPVDPPFPLQDGPLCYDITTENTLVGAQIGGFGEYNLGCRFSLAAGAKAGVYNNHISAYSRIGGPGGRAVINNGPNDGREWAVDVSKNDVAMLGELELAALYQITPCWRASAGYRIVGVTGVALPTDQIYPDLRGLQDVELVDSHGSLFMHGFTFTVETQF